MKKENVSAKNPLRCEESRMPQTGAERQLTDVHRHCHSSTVDDHLEREIVILQCLHWNVEHVRIRN